MSSSLRAEGSAVTVPSSRVRLQRGWGSGLGGQADQSTPPSRERTPSGGGEALSRFQRGRAGCCPVWAQDRTALSGAGGRKLSIASGGKEPRPKRGHLTGIRRVPPLWKGASNLGSALRGSLAGTIGGVPPLPALLADRALLGRSPPGPARSLGPARVSRGRRRRERGRAPDSSW